MDQGSRLAKLSWIPPAFVVAALVALLAVPLVVSQRTRELARQLDDANRARILLNDLEAAGATQVIIVGQPLRVDDESGPLSDRAVRAANEDELALDSLLRDASPQAKRDFEAVRNIGRTWRNARPGDTRRLQASAGREDDPLRLLAASERLDEELRARIDSLRVHVRRLQDVNVTSALVLAPIALVSALMVVFAGRRSQNLARRLEAERAALAASIESRSALARGITHDLKNPIGAAAGYADLLLDGVAQPLTSEQKTMVERIRKLLVDSVGTISSLLDAEVNDRIRVRPRDVDITAVVRELVQDSAATAQERSLTVTVVGPDRLIWRTDDTHLRHILGNLLSNAIKYTPSGGRVRVEIAAGDQLTIAVCDTGPGIPPDQREAAFAEFVRLDATRDQVAGHGVGLAFSRRLAQALGGELSIDSEPEGGARVILSLPKSVVDARQTPRL